MDKIYKVSCSGIMNSHIKLGESGDYYIVEGPGGGFDAFLLRKTNTHYKTFETWSLAFDEMRRVAERLTNEPQTWKVEGGKAELIDDCGKEVGKE